jgi:hypothetical protein
MAPVKRRPAPGQNGKKAARHPAPAAAPAAAGRAVRDGVALAWARDRDGRLAAARALDAASRRARAPFACPGCGEEVIPHLGERRARHFAHRPGSACPLTSPETALHYNAKTRLLALCEEAFRGARRVTLLTRCGVCRRADPRDLAGLGDEAVNEGAVGPLRADVLVRRGGAPALAIEVLVTHAVEAGKEAALAAAGVPAVEIDAREAWEVEVPGTGPTGPIPVPGTGKGQGKTGDIQVPGTEVICDRTLGFPPCPACQTVGRAEADRARGGEAAEIAELESYRARGLLGERAKPLSSQVISDAPFTAAERADLAGRFRCPECRALSLLWGTRLVRHACPGQPPRPVAWRGYDGRPAELGWWKR